jgi:hypothetical protein
MAAQEQKTSFNLIDSAIGPMGVQSTTYINFDIDDYVHTTVLSQAVLLKTILAAKNADPALASSRPPVNLEGTTLGGF